MKTEAKLKTLSPNPALTPRERLLLNALEVIVLETMDYAPKRPISSESYLPDVLIDVAQDALAMYGRAIQPTQVPA